MNRQLFTLISMTAPFIPLSNTSYSPIQCSAKASQAYNESTPPSLSAKPVEGVATIFRMLCPQCGKISDFSFEMACQHRSKSGRVCGWRMPLALPEMNREMRKSIRKHTIQPTGQFTGLISFNPSTGYYLDSRQTVVMSGDVHFDTQYNTFCLYLAPSGAQGIATACSGRADISYPVSGIKMFTNSSAQEHHHHYANQDEKMQFICSSGDVVIEPQNVSHPGECWIWKEGEKIASWNPSSKCLWSKSLP